MINLKYSEILRFNKELEKDNWLNVYNILLLSNIVVHQGKEIIEYFLRVDGINSNVKCGDYDNIVQESQQQKQINATIIFWELANLVDGLQYKVELLTKAKIDEIENKVKSEIDLTIQNLGDCPLVLINKFSSIFFSFLNLENNKLDDLAYRLNLYLESFTNANLKLINLENVIAYVGIKNSFNQRYYYSSKTLYTVDFFKAYAQFIKPFFMSTNGKSKKALIFDCDNTLWKGILGEEGIDGIKMSPETTDGLIFQEIQSIAVSLSNQGVIIGL